MRALGSALEQTVGDVEVIVVVDGEDPDTERALAAIADERVRTVSDGVRVGNAEARNRGVASARAPWVALLDDDDRWHPDKLEAQLELAARSGAGLPIITCRMRVLDERGSTTVPRRRMRPDESLAEYLFCRRSLRWGEAGVQTSTLMAPTRLLRSVRFAAGMPRYVDWHWGLRADRVEGVRWLWAGGSRPLVDYDMRVSRERITNERDMGEAVAWAAANRDLMSRSAYAGFLLTVATTRPGGPRAIPRSPALLGEAVRRGRPRPLDLLVGLLNLGIPEDARRSLGGLGWRLARRAGDQRRGHGSACGS